MANLRRSLIYFNKVANNNKIMRYGQWLSTRDAIILKHVWRYRFNVSTCMSLYVHELFLPIEERWYVFVVYHYSDLRRIPTEPCHCWLDFVSVSFVFFVFIYRRLSDIIHIYFYRYKKHKWWRFTCFKIFL